MMYHKAECLDLNEDEHIKKWYAELFDLEQLNQDDYIEKLKNWKYNKTTAKLLYELKNDSYQIINDSYLRSKDYEPPRPFKYLYKLNNNCDIMVRPDSKDSNIINIEVESTMHRNDAVGYSAGLGIRSCDTITVDESTTYKDILLSIYKCTQVILEQKIRAFKPVDTVEQTKDMVEQETAIPDTNYKDLFIKNDNN